MEREEMHQRSLETRNRQNCYGGQEAERWVGCGSPKAAWVEPLPLCDL